MKSNTFKLIMISAMYENGGNTTHRFLDGHPELFVYPFESQPGTTLVADYLSSMFPLKYRWPEFPLEGDFASDYERIIDEECKVRLNTQYVSKFRDADLHMTNKGRKEIFLKILKGKDRTRANIIEAFFRATFEAWKNYNSSGKEKAYVGYSPIIGVDGQKILSDFPFGHVLHVVRNPYSAYADTKKRPVPYGLDKYIQIWNVMQLQALTYANMYPKNFHVVRFDDLIAGPKAFFLPLCKKLGISYSDSLMYPSWNGKKLDELFPWGTIRIPTPAENKATMKELTRSEYLAIKERTTVINKVLGFDRL